MFGRCRLTGVRLPVHLAAVADFNHGYEEVIVMDGVDDPVSTLPNAIGISAAELPASWRARLIGQGSDARYDALAFSLVLDPLDLFGCRALELDPIAGHAPSGL